MFLIMFQKKYNQETFSVKYGDCSLYCNINLSLFYRHFPSSADANVSHNSKDFSQVSTSHQFYENHIQLAYQSKNEFLTLHLFRGKKN